jgi:hypothetical protein
MKYGENVSYDAYFKWGLVLSRAGEAVISCSADDYSVKDAVTCYQMLFKTTKFFDNFFKMRDTLVCHFDSSNRLLYSKKASDEGDYYSIDEVTFKHSEKSVNQSDSKSAEIHSLRYTPKRVRIDTVLRVEGDVADFLGAMYFLRRIDRNRLSSGATYPLTIAIGRALIKMKFCYQNQAIVEHGGRKFNTRYFTLDIYDDTFASPTASAEVWVGDDDNFIPVKIRSKLRIGYAEIYFKSSSNLAHPLDCEVK